MEYNPVMELRVSNGLASVLPQLHCSAPKGLITSNCVSENYSANRSDLRCCQQRDVCHAEWSRYNFSWPSFEKLDSH